ncbi:hypothetical protein JCM8115_003502 [Rhodotorula mucilaginosa]
MHAIAHGAVKTPAPTLVATRQPPSRPPTEPAPMRVGGSQRKTQEGEDSDADSLSSASSSMPERATSTATTASDGTWNAPTTSKAMRNLVLKREEIFAAQRQARDYRFQDISREAVETAFSQRTTSSAAYLCGFRHYVKFCSRVDVPPFPITHTMMALWSYEKCSNREGYSTTYKVGVGLAADAAKHLWTSLPVFHAMHQFHPDGIAVWEFLREPQRRKNASSKASSDSAAKTASKQRRPRHERQPLAASFDSAAKSSKDTESENTNAPDNGNRGHGLGEKVEDALPVDVRGLPT